MSAFLSSADAINALATYWDSKHSSNVEWALNSAVRLATPVAPPRLEGLRKILQENIPIDAVFHLLLTENIRSLQHAYPLNPEMWETDESYKPRHIPCVWLWVDRKKTGGIAGILQGYIYQSCNHPEWRNSIAREICNQITDHLLRDFCESTSRWDGNTLFWASWTEPQS